MKRPSFHAANLASDRIQRVLKALKRAGRCGLSTMKLGWLCNSTRPASDVSEANEALRKAGKEQFVSCRYAGTTDSGRRMYIYKLNALI